MAQDLIEAMQKVGLLAKFEKLPPSHQREYIQWIDEAKKPETRVRRVQQTIERLSKA